MLIQGAFMNVSDSVSSDQFLKFLSEEAPFGHYFVAQPPPDIIMTAAIDWRVILPDPERVDVLATALWSGYEELVKPHGREDLAPPALFIQIKNHRGDCDQFTIGKDIEHKDGFLHRVKETVAILASRSGEGVLQEIENTASSDYWIEMK